MSKRISRKAITLAAAALLAAPFASSVVSNAQTSTSPTITLSSKVVGTAPTGVTGVSITIGCQNLLGSGTNVVTYGVTNGAAGIPTYWPLTGPVTPNPGTSCAIIARVTGTGNLDKGAIAISVGGTDRTSGSGVIPATSTTLATLQGVTGVIPVFSSTDIVVTLTYPQITIKKVVTGAEPVAGFAYPIAVNCSNTATVSPFIQQLGSDPTVPLGSLVVNGPGTYVSFGSPAVRMFDVRTTLPLPTAQGPIASDLIGNAANVTSAGASLTPALAPFQVIVPLAPVGTVAGVVGFNGVTAVKGGESKVLGINDIPGLSTTSVCEAQEVNSNGAPSLSYSSTQANPDGTVSNLPGVGSGATFRSAITKANQTITVTNAFLYYGDLVVSKVVTGDSKTNIATFEISVSCNNGGPKDTFLLKDRQSKVYTNILEGTSCQIIETKSDGAVASYSDNSGDVVNDGRVVIKRRGTGCAQAGAPAAVSTGSVAPVVAFDECWANVIVTNDYNPPATTAAPATTVAPAAPAAAPAVTPAPAAAAAVPEAQLVDGSGPLAG